MNGLALARAFYTEFGRPLLEECIPDLLAQATVGLVGEGSECLGFDDAVSRDHDFGAAFCFWLPDAVLASERTRIEEAFSRFPDTWQGYPVRFKPEKRLGRVGPLGIDAFYTRFLGRNNAPSTAKEWLAIPEFQLLSASNGEVFEAHGTAFTDVRAALTNYYPDEVRNLYLASRCMQMAQSGQYNYPRSLARGQSVAAFLALAHFLEAALSFLHLANRRYMPFYKHAPKSAATLPLLYDALTPCLALLAEERVCKDEEQGDEAQGAIESFAEACVGFLRSEGLSDAQGTWLWVHGPAIMAHVHDPFLRSQNILAL